MAYKRENKTYLEPPQLLAGATGHHAQTSHRNDDFRQAGELYQLGSADANGLGLDDALALPRIAHDTCMKSPCFRAAGLPRILRTLATPT